MAIKKCAYILTAPYTLHKATCHYLKNTTRPNRAEYSTIEEAKKDNKELFEARKCNVCFKEE